jgi:hypothetical protein
MERAAPLTDRRGRSGSRRSVRSTRAEEWSQDGLNKEGWLRTERQMRPRTDNGKSLMAVVHTMEE